jgi:hypothetical protein
MNKKKRFTMKKFQNIEGIALQQLRKKGGESPVSGRRGSQREVEDGEREESKE